MSMGEIGVRLCGGAWASPSIDIDSYKGISAPSRPPGVDSESPFTSLALLLIGVPKYCRFPRSKAL